MTLYISALQFLEAVPRTLTVLQSWQHQSAKMAYVYVQIHISLSDLIMSVLLVSVWK